jgi:2'-5' RNA ligase
MVPLPTDPVFLMLRPDEVAARCGSRLAWRLRDQNGMVGEPLEEDRLHVSLCSLPPFGHLTPGIRAKIGDLVMGLTMPPFRAGFRWVESFRREHRKRPLVLRGGDETLIGAMMLQEELTASLSKIYPVRPRKAFTPHMTLLYDWIGLSERVVEEICWTVREVVLVCSLRGRHRHITLGRWPLLASA